MLGDSLSTYQASCGSCDFAAKGLELAGLRQDISDQRRVFFRHGHRTSVKLSMRLESSSDGDSGLGFPDLPREGEPLREEESMHEVAYGKARISKRAALDFVSGHY